MRNNKLLAMALPVAGILAGLVLYQQVCLGLRSEAATIREQQAVKEETLRRYIAVIAGRPELEKKRDALREALKAARIRLIEGEPVSLASAALQEAVKGIVTGRGGSVSSERTGKPEDMVNPSYPNAADRTGNTGKGKGAVKGEGSRFQVITVSLDATVPDTASLSDILYQIETRTPMLVVKELDARVRNFKEPRELSVKLDVSGLYGGGK